MTIAINYDSVSTAKGGREIFGMQVAVFDWMRAFFSYTTHEKIYLLVRSSAGLEEIENVVQESGIDGKRLIPLDGRFVQENFTQFSTIFRADPMPQKLFWQRQITPGPGYTFCGLAHAISGSETGEILEQYCLAPSAPGDAIVCPSRAVQSAIRKFWELYSDYLKTHFAASYRCPVELPIIPLGIDIDRFVAKTTDAKRASQRATLSLADHTVVLLWVGRMSQAIKGHPIAMFQAAEKAAIKAAATGGPKIHLVMYGYFIPEEAEPAFKALAADICKTAEVTFIANSDSRFPDGVWAMGDIFLSLIDNMQESFGLTPIEAMAAKLPRVISDWNGYRDSVNHGEDGFLVPTSQPPMGQGDALSAILLSGKEIYGGFLAKTALAVTVDTDAAADFIVQLAADPAKRRTVAEKAFMRVKASYAWSSLIPRYEALWTEMTEKRRREANAKKNYPSVFPQCPDPFSMYEAYATAPLAETDRLITRASADTIKMLWTHEINTFALDTMIAPDEITKLINAVRAKPQISTGEILRQFISSGKTPDETSAHQAALWRTLGWLIKLDILSRR